MIDNTKIYTIIVTHNGEKWIRKCLTTISKSFIKTGIIVVDNNSKDHTLAIIKNEFSEVILLKQPKNLGFGAANNLGMCYALNQGADYVFLLNQDAYLEVDTIEKLVDAHKKAPEYGVISPMHLNGAGDKLDYNFSRYIVPNACPELYSDIFLNKIKDGIYTAKFVNAAAWLISRSCLETVGGFNPSFFHYGEDDNYAQRVKYHGLKLGVLPHIIVRHDRGSKQGNVYFEDPALQYKKHLVLKYSNPFYEGTFRVEYKKLLKMFIKAGLTLNFKTVKSVTFKLRILNNIDKRVVLGNREISIIKQPAFLANPIKTI